MPPMWWQHVRSYGALNVLVNYWFGQRQDLFPFAALMLAMHSIRELPASERAAWRTWFDHYVFGDGAVHAVDHLPPHAQGVLRPPSPQRARMIIDYLVGFCRRGRSASAASLPPIPANSEERRVGTECICTSGTPWSTG